MKRLKRDRRGISNVIIVMLSLVLVVIIADNVILWSYQMNQLDWEKMEEDIIISNVEPVINGTIFSFQNMGALTSHLVSLWVDNATDHRHYDINLFVNSGENSTYTATNIILPTGNFIAKVVTDKGNLAVFVGH
jgi:23S rRNA U2552 (ribose-2'-O)-methylase RlmE/FtsJ